MIILISEYTIIDMHAHLRNEIAKHTKIAKKAGIEYVVCMTNCKPPLDNLEMIKKYMNIANNLDSESHSTVMPVSAITIGREGKKLVDIENIRPYVVGFSDDGNDLYDLYILEDVLGMNINLMLHLEPEEIRVDEVINMMTEKTESRVHFQHISKKDSVNLIRQAKSDGLPITCETCFHYIAYDKNGLHTDVNPPLGTRADVEAVKEGLADGIIDCIVTDYAPEPRPMGTGIASFDALMASCFLVSQGMLTKEKFFDKISTNPRRIIESSGYKFKVF